MGGHLFVISAPSGCGKSSIINEILEHNHHLSLSISYTTRPPRKTETNGKDYYFISKEEFKTMEKNQEFIETTERFNNCYGTSKKQLEKALENNQHIIFDIDYLGAKNIQNYFPHNTTLILIIPPSIPILEQRLKNRNSETSASLKMRLSNAQNDIEKYSKKYDHVVVNDKLHDAIQEIQTILTFYT